jgi:hypothetical protein
MSDETLERIARIAEEQLKWTKLSGMTQLKSIFEENLRTDDDKRVYELSDGERSIRDIEKITNVGRTKIAALWKKWYKMGIMERSEKYEGKRMKKSFSLSGVGIDVELPTDQQVTEMKVEEFE